MAKTTKKAAATPRKRVPKMPPRAPQSLGEACVWATMAEIKEDDILEYAAAILMPDAKRSTLSEKKKRDGVRAVLKFAAIGWAFHHWVNESIPTSTTQ